MEALFRYLDGLCLQYPERIVFAVFSFIITEGTWWGLNLALYFVYKYNLFEKYKIQGKKWPNKELMKECLKIGLITHAVVYPFVWYYLYVVMKAMGTTMDSATIPSTFTFVWQTVVFFLINDFFFYWIHRFLHHPRIYKHIHKKHHEFKTTVGIAADYSHPLEGIFSNTFPTIIGPILFGAHLSVFWVYLVLRIWETVDAHSGYNFPFSPWSVFPSIQGGADKHDFHHSHNVGNFGMLHIWDPLMGTDKPYIAWQKKNEQKAKSNTLEDKEITSTPETAKNLSE